MKSLVVGSTVTAYHIVNHLITNMGKDVVFVGNNIDANHQMLKDMPGLEIMTYDDYLKKYLDWEGDAEFSNVIIAEDLDTAYPYETFGSVCSIFEALDGSLDVNGRMIMVSSHRVYEEYEYEGSNKKRPALLVESAPLNPHTLVGFAYAVMESDIFRQWSMIRTLSGPTILRPGYLYGPGLENKISYYATCAITGQNIVVSKSEKSYCSLANLVRAIEAVIKAHLVDVGGRTFNVADGKPLQDITIAHFLNICSNRNQDINDISTARSKVIEKESYPTEYIGLDIDKIRTELKWEPVSMSTGLQLLLVYKTQTNETIDDHSRETLLEIIRSWKGN